MRKLCFILILFFVATMFSCNNISDNEFVVKLKIQGDTPAEVYLRKFENYQFITLDTAKVENGVFVFKGILQAPDLFYLTWNESYDTELFLEPGHIKVTIQSDNPDTPVVTGSVSDVEYRQYLVFQRRQDEETKELMEAFSVAEKMDDSVKMMAIEMQIDQLQDKQFEETKEYIRKNSKSFVAPYIALEESYRMVLSEMEEFIALFDDNIKRSPSAISLSKWIDILKSVSVGKTAPEFTLPNTHGEPVSLHQYRGKILLVEFWASWCGPCRAESGNIIAAYNKYKEQGFDVLGVALEYSKENWLEAIVKDKLPWTQVSDLQFFQSPIVKLYGIDAIPANLLLDREGVIIGRDLRGKELTEKLEVVFIKAE